MALPSATVLALAHEVRLHPRIAYQGLLAHATDRAKLCGQLPRLVPFRRAYHGAIAVVDWDHRLPSKHLAFRIYAYYDEASLSAGEEAYDNRLEEIGQRDRFPEFDVPDFDGLPADEAYEVEITPEGDVLGCRLTSAWRRDVREVDAVVGVGIARASAEYARIAASASERPRHLGGLEAVSWTPPCESGHPRWTLDVWYLLAFDGRVGSGRGLLVDLDEQRVVAVRDFSVRAG
ncbi:MAG: hypothetical protein HY698_11265 [Deltaproteobacteria bacterium]|nr:hypothetical protein [Deltaproteobacteria bacterium]